MSTEIIWSVLSIGVSAIFGIIGLYLTLKSKYPGGITFVNEQTIELFDAIGKTLDKLEVTYNGDSVNENLVLLNGAFINFGKIDISQEMVEKPISLMLPTGYKWLTAKVVGSAGTVKAKLKVSSDREILIETGLFRCKEFVKFHALAQVPNDDTEKSISDKLREVLTFTHRITNTKKIDEMEIKNEETNKKDLKGNILLFGLMLFFIIVMSLIMVGIDSYKKIVFPYEISPSKTELVRIRTYSDELVKISSIQSGFEKKIRFQDFLKGIKGEPKLKRKEPTQSLFLMFLAAFILVLLFGTQLLRYIRNKRVLEIFDG